VTQLAARRQQLLLFVAGLRGLLGGLDNQGFDQFEMLVLVQAALLKEVFDHLFRVLARLSCIYRSLKLQFRLSVLGAAIVQVFLEVLKQARVLMFVDFLLLFAGHGRYIGLHLCPKLQLQSIDLARGQLRGIGLQDHLRVRLLRVFFAGCIHHERERLVLLNHLTAIFIASLRQCLALVRLDVIPGAGPACVERLFATGAPIRFESDS